MADRPPLFTTFDEAWANFDCGGSLVPIELQRQHFVRGRAQFLALHVPVAEMPVADDIVALQDQLAGICSLSLMPPELLHISVRGIGFQVIAKSQPDDILRQEVGAIAERAAKALKNVAAIDVTIGPVNVFPDALILQVQPVEPMRDILRRLDDALATPDAFPYNADSYLPHVTIATFLDAKAAAEALREALPPLREAPPAAATIARIDFARWWFTGHDPAAWPELDLIRTYKLK
jgi:2'-5' RNA ligase